MTWRSVYACVPCLLLSVTSGCFEDSAPIDDDDGVGDSEGDDDDDDDDVSGDDDDDATGDDDDDDDATGDDDDDDDDDTTGDDDDDDDDAPGYPPEVTEHLDLPFPPANYADPDLPAHFEVPPVAALDNTPADNPITNHGATLGRVLFHDFALSSNETIACASCHRQDIGFTDDLAFSEGFDGGQTGRNSMNLANAGWYATGRFFWDERAETLEDQVLMPIQDPVEMGLDLETLVARVSAQPYYPDLFMRAFGDSEVTADGISRALAQYVRAIRSYRAPYDIGLAQTGDAIAPFPNFSTEENLGKQLFFSPAGNCAVCHVGNDGPPPGPGVPPPNQAIFMPTEPLNNGLDADTSADEGAGDGAFKSPSLRNVELTAPYMHDGRLDTLEEVIEHYDNGVMPHPNLDPRLRGPGGAPQQLNLTEQEKAALVAFLRTLTDEPLREDDRFSDPFF